MKVSPRKKAIATLGVLYLVAAAMSCENRDLFLDDGAGEPVCQLSATTLHFEEIVGRDGEAEFTVKNVGEGVLFGQVGITVPHDHGRHLEAFEVVAGEGSYSLPPGATHRIRVRFAPILTDTSIASVALTGGACRSVGPTGIGLVAPDCLVAPDTVDFGTVDLSAPAESTIWLINSTTTSFTGTATSTSPEFVVTGDPSYAVGGNDSTSITIQFGPTAEASFAGTIQFDDGFCSDLVVLGDGQGTPACSLSTTSIAFGSVQATNSTFDDRTYTIFNTGNGSLSVTLQINGQPANGPFSIVGSSSFSIPPFGSQVVTVRFDPDQTFADYGDHQVTITGMGGCTVTCTGTGRVEFSPHVLAILNAGDCSGCHPSLATNIFDYNAVVPALVNTSDPGSSRLLTRPDQSGHQGSPQPQWRAGQEVYETVFIWIDQGAPQ